MTKRFCDLCGKPAVETDRTEVRQSYGKVYEKQIPQGFYQAEIIATIVFTFRNHRTGFGGPPDLCAECAGNLCGRLTEVVRQQSKEL